MQPIKILGNLDTKAILSSQLIQEIDDPSSNLAGFVIEVDTEDLKEILNTSHQAIRKITRIG